MFSKKKKKSGEEIANVKQELEAKIAAEFSDHLEVNAAKKSIEYQQFKQDDIASVAPIYQKFCQYFGKFPSITPGKDLEDKLNKAIETTHLNVTVQGIMSFAIYGGTLLMFLIVLLTLLITQDIIMALVAVAGGFFLIVPLMRHPIILMENWRMKAGNQMVLAVFYIVTYMRHTSNLERAIEFASDHIGDPLALDFRKLLWDVETEKYESIGESIESYLLQWKGVNDEFIESIHLIQSSLLEDQNERRLQTLDKSLDIILTGTYEKMLHYAHNLQSPITTLHMLGVILPILGLVILPLLVAFVPEVRWYHIALIYNIVVPLSVYYMGIRILAKRPSGYSAATVDENNPELLRRKKQPTTLLGIPISISPAIIAIVLITLFVVVGFFPIWIHWLDEDFEMGFGAEVPKDERCGHQFCLLDYHFDTKEESPNFGTEIGPYGLGASLLSLLIPLGIGLGLSLYFSLRSQHVIEIRRETEQLENEFSSGLFQLGNRLDDGIPPESAVGLIAASMPDTVSGSFFNYVSSNIRKLGLSLHDAIFNTQIGALVHYPSNLIESSMKVLIESSKKGPRIAAQALTNISRYLKEMHVVNERLQDLMAEVLSSMRSQINFLTPIIAGIVIGITSMITNILSQLSSTLSGVGENTGGVSAPTSNLAGIFFEGLPTFYFQIIVGLYVVQIVFILSILINGIKNGVDPLEERYLLGKNLLRAVGFYVIVAAIVMVIFNVIAASIVQSSLV